MKRIQRTRRSGWHLPQDTVIVTRPSRWGNPYPVSPNDGPTARAIAVERFARYAVDMAAGEDWPLVEKVPA